MAAIGVVASFAAVEIVEVDAGAMDVSENSEEKKRRKLDSEAMVPVETAVAKSQQQLNAALEEAQGKIHSFDVFF